MRPSSFSTVLFVFCALFQLSAKAGSEDQQLITLLSNTQTLKAHFSQKLYDAQGNILQQSSGNMVIKRPDFFWWEITSPTHQFLIADGRQVKFYDVGLQQMSVSPQIQVEKNSPAALLIQDPRGIKNNYLIKSSDGGKSFSLTTRNKQSLFRNIKLTFVDGILQSMDLWDSLGQHTKLGFSKVQKNLLISDAIFRINPPPHVQIIHS